MINQEHVLNQIPDYILGLLTRQERLWVEQHTAVCGKCRQVLHQESELSHLVRTTLAAVKQPSSLRLRQLMPAPPRSRTALMVGQRWHKQLAVAVILISLIWGAFGLYEHYFTGSTITPDQLAVTATMTHEPTMTLASADEDKREAAVSTAVPGPIVEASATPSPAPTPIAALPSLSLN
jgi:predicted anti-sigma-YlaC factor YlaD